MKLGIGIGIGFPSKRKTMSAGGFEPIIESCFSTGQWLMSKKWIMTQIWKYNKQ